MATKGNNLVNRCLLALSESGVVAWKNNTGMLPGANGRPIRFGLCEGSSDIIGMCRDGLFLAIECKTENDTPTHEQLNFIATVKRMGGRAGIARCADDAVKIALDTLA
jgi:hypothetical protein